MMNHSRADVQREGPPKQSHGRLEPTSPVDHGPQVFLGGTCGDSDWRDQIAIPMLKQFGLSFYNPQLPAGQWTPDLIPIEAKAKATAACHLYVITGESRGVASMVEAAELVTSAENVVLCVQGYQGEHDDFSTADVNRGRRYLEDLAVRRECAVFPTVEEATAEAVQRLQAMPTRPQLLTESGMVAAEGASVCAQ
eukprot:TRINITY_DN927_c0_g1_i11.p1 TRINITY_DN927_c0_g1~~TRINITY_DN927_c0_g1_i11.p1  ORF type:complete len:195 (+),score=30.26 TRINITY_DN927_c0_g1_i11:180-764(+)